jgi:hypothetical protein
VRAILDERALQRERVGVWDQPEAPDFDARGMSAFRFQSSRRVLDSVDLESEI